MEKTVEEIKEGEEQKLWRERIRKFDGRLIALESPLQVGGWHGEWLECFLALLVCLLMLLPLPEVSGASFYLLGIHAVLLLSDTWIYIRWALAHTLEDQRQMSWKQYLRYVPMDWREYRRHRMELLLRHIGRLFLAAQLCQVLSQLAVGTLLRQGCQWQSFVYVTAVFFVCAVLPGIYQIRKYA